MLTRPSSQLADEREPVVRTDISPRFDMKMGRLGAVMPGWLNNP